VAGLINELITRLTVQGEAEVVSAVDNVTKAQTRQANSSASTGRQFSAQAQGLGGLVSAYAGAAANIFAISQAFEALNKASRLDQTIEGTKILAAQVGESGSSIINKLKEITNGQFSMAQAAQAANIALSAGFDSKQLNGLTNVAYKASRVLGRDLTDSVDRLVKGSAKLQPELLDELGIFTRINPAVEKYSLAMGVSSASLTDFQRRQAFANAVIEEGTRKFGVITVSANSTQASFEKVAATFSDLAQKIGSSIANIIAPALDFVGKNSGNAFLAIAALGTVVFKNLFSQIGAFATSSIAKLGEIADKANLTQTQLVKVNAGVAASQESAVAATAKGAPSLGRFIGAGGVGAGARDIVTRATEGTATTTQMTSDVKFIKEQAIPAQEAYRATIAASSRDQAAKTAAEAQTAARIKLLTDIQAGYTAALEATSAGSSRLATITVFLQGAMARLATVMTVVSTALGYIGIIIAAVQIVGSIFDIDILGAVATQWNKLWESSKNLKLGIEGVSAAAINASKIDFKNTFDSKDMENISKKVQDRLSTATSITEDTLSRVKEVMSISQGPMQGAAPTRDLGNNLDQTKIEELKKQFSDFGLVIENTGNTSVVKIKELKDGLEGLTQLKLLDLVKEYSDLSDKLANTNTNSDSYKELNMNLVALGLTIDAIKNKSDALAQISGNIAAKLQIDPSKVTASLLRQGYALSENGKNWTLAGVEIGKFSWGQSRASKAMEDYAAASTAAENITYDINGSLASGGASAEYLAKNIEGAKVALEKYYTQVIATVEANKNNTGEQWKALYAYDAEAEKVKQQIKLVDDLANAQKITTNIEKVFAGERLAFSDAIAKGNINANGEIAKSDKEVSLNKMSFLAKTVLVATEAEKKLKAASLIDPNRSKYQSQIEAGKVAAEAAVGASFTLAKENKTINDDLDKRLLTLNNEKAILDEQVKLSEIRRDTAESISISARDQLLTQSNIANVLEVQKKAAQDTIDISRAKLAITNNEIAGQNAILSAQGAQAKAAADLKIAQAERAGANALGPLKSEQMVQNALPNLSSTDQKLNLQDAIAKQEYANSLKIIDLKSKAAQTDFANQKSLIDLQVKSKEAEIRQKATEIEQTNRLLAKQTEINKANNDSAIATLQQNLYLMQQKQLENAQTLVIEKQKIDAATQSRVEELKLLQQRIDIIAQEAAVFKAAADSNAAWVNAYIDAVQKAFGGNQITKLQVNTNFDSIIKGTEDAKKKMEELISTTKSKAEIEKADLTANATSKATQLDADIAAQQKIIKEKADAIKEQTASETTLNAITLKGLESQKAAAEAELKALDIKKQTIGTNAATELENSAKQREDAARTLADQLKANEIAKNSFLQIANELAGAVKNNLNKGVDSFYDAIKNGTLTLQSFRQGVVGVFKDILFDFAKAATKELLVKPVTDAFSSGLGSLANSIFGTGASDLAKTAPAVSTELTKNIGENVGKVAGGLKDIGVTSVYIMGAAPGVMCCGEAAAAAGAGTAGGAAAAGTAGVAGVAGEVSTGAVKAATASTGGVIDLNTKVPATTPAASAVQAATAPVVAAQTITPSVGISSLQNPNNPNTFRGGENTLITAGNTQLSRADQAYLESQNPLVTNSSSNPLIVAGTGTGGALSTDISSVAQNANIGGLGIGNIAANSTSNGLAPFDLTNTNTWGNNALGIGTPALNPTGPGAFGALGPTGNNTWNANNQGWNPGEAGQMTQPFSTQFGGNTPLNLGTGGAGQFTTQQFTGSSAWSLDAGGKMGDRAAGLDTSGVQASLDNCDKSLAKTAGGFDDFIDKLGIGSSSVSNLANKTDDGAVSLAKVTPASEALTESQVAEQAVKLESTALDEAEGAAATVTAGEVELLGEAATSAATRLAVSGGGIGGGGGFGGSVIDLFGLTAAIGGSVDGTSSWQRFASGGAKQRDSVPALLEPGEFVIRKDATKKLGQNVLERINATGRISDTQDKLVSNVESQLKDLTKNDLTDPNSVKQLDKNIKLLDKTTIGADPSQSSSHTARLYGAGMKRFASGGGAKQRDSVPALLESGEYVIRKDAARKLGNSALEVMNATGRLPMQSADGSAMLYGKKKRKDDIRQSSDHSASLYGAKKHADILGNAIKQSSDASASLYGQKTTTDIIQHFATGGSVDNKNNIPPLLQSGEFTMRKSSVDSIGKDNMKAMGDKDKTPVKPTNIKVQIENTGHQKQAEQGETQFDGETAIVKLILKDLSSNGPIRRTIRGTM